MAGLQALSGSVSSLAGRTIQPGSCSQASGRSQRLVTTAVLRVRPYTVRRGDTFASIAKKRDVALGELLKLNHSVSPDALEEGQTLLLPAGQLSARDKEILEGIGPWTYRSYPVRTGETLEDIISKRKISRAEMEALNPTVDLDHLSANQIIKLPANKYTVREQEMLSTFAPSEFFSSVTHMNKATALASVGLLVAAIFIWRQKNDDA